MNQNSGSIVPTIKKWDFDFRIWRKAAGNVYTRLAKPALVTLLKGYHHSNILFGL